jgi:DNA-binding transcriptional ArsR family regulator
MSRLQNTVRDEASCRRHGPRRDRRARGPGREGARQCRPTAIAHPLRLQIIAELAGGRVHVSELARRLGMSRPLLYMHLDRLEKAGLSDRSAGAVRGRQGDEVLQAGPLRDADHGRDGRPRAGRRRWQGCALHMEESDQ